MKATPTQWIEDQPFQLASSLSYYTLFSLAPLLIIVIAIAGFAFGRAAAEQQIVGTIEGMIGQQSAEAVQGMIRNASSRPKAGMISAAVGIVTLILGAGVVVGQLQTSLNTIWGVEPKAGQGVWGFLRQRFISLAMVLRIGFRPAHLICTYNRAVRDDLQVFAGRADSVARHLDRRRSDLNPLHHREIPNRALSRSQRRELNLWGSRLGDHNTALGVLLIVDIVSWRGIYPSICNPARIRRCSCGKCRADRRQPKKKNTASRNADWRAHGNHAPLGIKPEIELTEWVAKIQVRSLLLYSMCRCKHNAEISF